MSNISNDFEIVIVTYNSSLQIRGLLDDIQVYSKKALGRTIIVDNASLDKTRLIIKKAFSQVRIVKNKVNLGYSRAVNQGFALCKSDYVFLINPDIRIVEQDFWEKLLKIIRNNRNIGAVGPLQFKDSKHKKLNFIWSYWSIKGLILYFNYLLEFSRNRKNKDPFPVWFLNCGCLLIRRQAFNKIGRLNEKYFLYGEEPDLFLKFKHFKYLSYLHPDASVIHFRERSLKTLSSFSRIKYKILSIRNISDALIRGFVILIKDWIE